MALGSDQSLIPSYQVHINSLNNGTVFATPGFVPSSFSQYASVVSASIPVSWYNTVNARIYFYPQGADFVETFYIPDGHYTISEICSLCAYDCELYSFWLFVFSEYK
jgi:hypothetical protein